MSTEASRLAALLSYDVLDTPPEPQFDDVVQLARTVCRVPVALVSLVAADRQWFKARAGLYAHETPLNQSVCAHAIKEREILVIPDLIEDERTSANTLVTGPPHIRFYAGAVLRTPDGEALGALCVIDDAPRPDGLTAEQTEALLALARQTMLLLHYRRMVADRDSAIARTVDYTQSVESAQTAGGVRTFEVDIAERKRTEANQQTLNQELSHRMKNTLAMVSAIATQTLRQASDQPAVETFARRILALSKAHDVLLKQTWQGAPIRSTIEEVVGIAQAGSDRFALSGPDIDINARSVLSFSLLLHELTTNAVKYGSLSRDGGKVLVDWRVEEAQLILLWQEVGGPPPLAPSRRGFGSRLIQNGLAGTGQADIRYDAGGLHAEFRAPIGYLAAP